MKVKVFQLRTEGFVQGHGLEFENGLVLHTPGKLFWQGKKKSDEVQEQLNEIVDKLAMAGFEVVPFGKE